VLIRHLPEAGRRRARRRQPRVCEHHSCMVCHGATRHGREAAPLGCHHPKVGCGEFNPGQRPAGRSPAGPHVADFIGRQCRPRPGGLKQRPLEPCRPRPVRGRLASGVAFEPAPPHSDLMLRRV